MHLRCAHVRKIHKACPRRKGDHGSNTNLTGCHNHTGECNRQGKKSETNGQLFTSQDAGESKTSPEGVIILGGSWGGISTVLYRVTILITHIKGLMTPLITTHEPPRIGLQQ